MNPDDVILSVSYGVLLSLQHKKNSKKFPLAEVLYDVSKKTIIDKGSKRFLKMIIKKQTENNDLLFKQDTENRRKGFTVEERFNSLF